MKRIAFGSIATSSQAGIVAVAISERGLVNTDLRINSIDKFVQRITHQRNAELISGGEQVDNALRQIREYLAGERHVFEIPIDWSGLTAFQIEVLKATLEIPYGETRSYGEIATKIERPHAARAVGQAEARNPIPLVIPCHRVIGAYGQMRGYGGTEGVGFKAWLLAFEAGDSV